MIIVTHTHTHTHTHTTPGSSGVLFRDGLEPKGYSLRITATIPGTSQRVVLRVNFRIQEEDKVFCLVNIINSSTAAHNQNATIEFVGNEYVESFYCRTDKNRRSSCKFHINSN